MFDRLGRIVARYWPMVLVTWIVLIIAMRLVAPRWYDVTHDGEFVYLPENMSSIQGEKLLEEAFPQMLSKSQLVLVLARKDGPLNTADMAVADRLVEMFTPEEGDDKSLVVGVLSHQTRVINEKLRSEVTPQGQAQLIVLQMRPEFMAIDNLVTMPPLFEKVDSVRRSADFPPGLELGITGSMAIGTNMLAASEESVRNTELATVLLVIAILAIVYRSPGFVLIPLLTIGLSVTAATDVVALLVKLSNQVGWFDFKIFRETRIFVVVILFGAGTDFCLFLIARFKEELNRGLGHIEAMEHTLGRVGDAVSASAMTTILGLSMMWFCDFGKFHFSGPSIALCLMVALTASLTLAPPLILLSYALARLAFGRYQSKAMRFLFGGGPAPGAEGVGEAGGAAGLWDWISRRIIARPGIILVASLLLMAPLLWEGLHVEMTFDFLNELPPSAASVRGTKLLQQYFPAGETGPITILAYDPKGGLDEQKAAWEKIQPLADQLTALEYIDMAGNKVHPITSVRSLGEPLGNRSGNRGFFGSIRTLVARSRSENIYLAQAPEFAGQVTRLDLIPQYGPFSVEGMRFLGYLETYLNEQVKNNPDSTWQGAEFYFLGPTAGMRDLKTVTQSDLALIKQLVPLAVLAVLIVLLRRPLVCAYLILTVLLGYYVTIGASELVFGWLYGDALHGLDWKVPMFLFVILVAVGQDYNVYLITRVVEEQKRLGMVEGLRMAVVRTGGIITSCGVIMAGTFASMLFGTLRAMHELGFSLALGVLLDTFIIRTVLVPSFVVIWDRFLERRRMANIEAASAAHDAGPAHSPRRHHQPNGDAAAEVRQMGQAPRG